jgi:predicted O-linked N-acetylglucosamine transferase (SPINDLY family)
MPPSKSEKLEERIRRLLDTGRSDEARRLACIPEEKTAGAELLRLRAVSISRLGDDAEAERLLRLAARRHPEAPLVYSDLGVVLAGRGRWSSAAGAFSRAVMLDESDAAAWLYLAMAHRQLGRLARAMRCYRRVLEREPANLSAIEGLLETAEQAGDLESVLPDLERARLAAPRERRLHRWIMWVHFEHGRDELACEHLFREARLGRPEIESIRLHARLGNPAYSADQQRRAYSRWIHRYTKPPKERAPAILRPSTRKLRIGYLTGEFTWVPAYHFLAPLARFHDPDLGYLFGYHSRAREDERTATLRRHCHRLYNVSGWPDERLVDRIRQDRIDILVDMSGHFDDNRLSAFRQRPASISFTYPNYPATTGVPEVDYIFTDRWIDPRDGARRYVEQPWHLPSGSISYYATDSPPVSPPPVLRNGHITFGLTQKPLKIHAGVWDAVAQCLRAVPRSRLLIQYASDDLHNSRSAACSRIRDEFARRGVPPARIRFCGRLSRLAYLELRSEIDIALDTWPYNGQTTTCDSLWMGTPTITMAGETHASRVGYSLLSRLGLDDWVATSQESYVELAAARAKDVRRLTELRQELRRRVRDRLNPRRFASEVQDAFRIAAQRHSLARGI